MEAVFVKKDAIAKFFLDVKPSDLIQKIESFSLLAEKEAVEIAEFEAGGYSWKLVLYPRGNKGKNVKDYISLYLSMANTRSLGSGWEVNVVYRLFLLNQKNDKYLVLQDEKRFHELKLEWGFDQFVSLKEFKDETKGYLDRDTCVFGAEVFVRKTNPKAECLSMIRNTSSSKYTWKIQNFSKLITKQESEVFTLGNHKWKIQLYPKGDGRASGSHLSIYLVVANAGINKILTKYKMSILDQVHGKNKTFNGEGWFKESGWGWPKFVDLSYFKDEENGLLVKDVCKVAVELTVLGISKAM